MDQIQWVERLYHNLSPMVLERKQELIGVTISFINVANLLMVSIVPAALSPIALPAPVGPLHSATPPVSLAQLTFNQLQQSHHLGQTRLPQFQWSRELVCLDKFYKDDEKFSGTNDNFALKVKLYYDKCQQVGLLPDAYLQGASIILSGQAQAYHYCNEGDIFFDNFCVKMRLFFEGPE